MRIVRPALLGMIAVGLGGCAKEEPDASKAPVVTRVGRIDPGGRALAMDFPAGRDDLAAVALGEGGVAILNLAHGDHPLIVGRAEVGSNIVSVEWHEGFLYAVDTETGLRVLDVRDPTNISETSHLSLVRLADQVREVRVFPATDEASPAHLFMASQLHGLSVLNLKDPSAPEGLRLANGERWGKASSVALMGERAYAAHFDGGISVYDISRPDSPRLVGSGRTGAHAAAIECGGEHCYMAGLDSGLEIISVVDDAPRLVGVGRSRALVKDVFLHEGYVFAVTELDSGRYGWSIYDVRNPSDPVIHSTYTTAGITEAISVHRDKVYVLEGTDGITYYRLDPEAFQ